MKVTAFIRKTSAKNNVTDLARVYFRVRDVGGVDIKAASERPSIPTTGARRSRGTSPVWPLVSEEKRMNFDRDIQQITHLITKEYHRGVDGNWLKGLIEEYHHPNINARGGNKAEEYLLSYQIQKIYRRDSACARQHEAPSGQSQQGAALRAFPARGHAPARIPPLHRLHHGR